MDEHSEVMHAGATEDVEMTASDGLVVVVDVAKHSLQDLQNGCAHAPCQPPPNVVHKLYKHCGRAVV